MHIKSVLFLIISSFQGAIGQLGSYSGQYGVGTVDIEVPVTSPSNLFNTTYIANGTAAFRLDTVYFSLFYPTDHQASSSKAQHPWLAAPPDLIAQGIAVASGASISPSLIQIGFQSFAGNLTIPATVDTPIVNGTQKFVVMIFSHGNPTMSQWYSQLYGELASRGIVVAAVTHRDGSSPATTVMLPNGTTYSIVAFTQAQVSGNLTADQFHAQQLQMRTTELNEIAKVLTAINNGNGSSVAQNNTRKEGTTLNNWTNRLDLANLVISGHSFGANTVFQYLNQPSALVPAGAAAPFDPGKDSGPFPNSTVSVPLLIPDSEEWSGVATDFYGQQHFDVVKNIAQQSLSKTSAAWFMTLLGTVHTSITDVGLIASSFAQFFTNETQFLTLDARQAILQYTNVTTEFVNFVQTKSLNNTHGVLVGGVSYPNFQLFPNASTLANPWEVHVAPNATANGKTSLGTHFEVSNSVMVSFVVFISFIFIL